MLASADNSQVWESAKVLTRRRQSTLRRGRGHTFSICMAGLFSDMPGLAQLARIALILGLRPFVEAEVCNRNDAKE
jgi:hypothetical protein